MIRYICTTEWDRYAIDGPKKIHMYVRQNSERIIFHVFVQQLFVSTVKSTKDVIYK